MMRHIFLSLWSDPVANPCVGKSTTTVIGDKPIRPAHPHPPKKIYFPPLITPPPEHPLLSPAQCCYLSIRRIYGTKKLFFSFLFGRLLRASTPPHAGREGEVGVGIGEENHLSYYLLSACGRVCFLSALLGNTRKRLNNSWKKYFMAIVWNLKLVKHVWENWCLVDIFRPLWVPDFLFRGLLSSLQGGEKLAFFGNDDTFWERSGRREFTDIFRPL